MIITYQDLVAVGSNEETRMNFIRRAITNHLSSQDYDDAKCGDEYFRRQNRDIIQLDKFIFNLQGQKVKDVWAPNYKLCSGFFRRNVMQQVSFLLGNGITWDKEDTKIKLGKSFDKKIAELMTTACAEKVAFGFWNYDHVDTFSLKDFVPLYDEENGALMAGIRFWRLSVSKPLRATLYEIDGYTDYMWNNNKVGQIVHEKRGYIQHVTIDRFDDTAIYDYTNYPTFPIIPLWANSSRQSELVGIREQIACYDIVKGGFANNLEEASEVYWIIHNAGGMKDGVTLRKFLDQLKLVHAAEIDSDDGQQLESKTIDVPYAAREALLNRLSDDIYTDSMALDINKIASGSVVQAQIEAAYEPLNEKCDDMEYQLLDFLDKLLAVAGIEGECPTFTRSMIANRSEQITNVIQAGNYLSADYITEKIMTLLGDGDRIDNILKEMDAESISRFNTRNESPIDDNAEELSEGFETTEAVE